MLQEVVDLSPAWFQAYAVGLVHASVCTNLPVTDATHRLNQEHPTGVGPWQFSAETHFRTGQPHPTPCEKYLESGRRHLLFEC